MTTGIYLYTLQAVDGVNMSMMSFLTEIFVAFMLNLGNVLQIVSAPGQQLIRPQGSMVMQTVPQAVPTSNPSATSLPQPGLPTTHQGDIVRFSINIHISFDAFLK